MPKRSFGMPTDHNDPRRHWTISTTYALDDGRTINENDQAELQGERGRHTFLKHVVTSTSEWLDFVGSGEQGVFRSVRADRVKRIFAKQLDTLN